MLLSCRLMQLGENVCKIYRCSTKCSAAYQWGNSNIERCRNSIDQHRHHAYDTFFIANYGLQDLSSRNGRRRLEFSTPPDLDNLDFNQSKCILKYVAWKYMLTHEVDCWYILCAISHIPLQFLRFNVRHFRYKQGETESWVCGLHRLLFFTIYIPNCSA